MHEINEEKYSLKERKFMMRILKSHVGPINFFQYATGKLLTSHPLPLV